MLTLRVILGAVFASAAAALPASSPTPSPTGSLTGSPTPTPSHWTSYVNMRIVGDNNVKIFNGALNNPGGNVILQTKSGGTHYCGYNTNGGKLPGGAPAVALDTLSIKKSFSWDATWDGLNYNVTTISASGGASQWGLYVNRNWTAGQPSCDTSFKWGANEVWWIQNPSQYEYFLDLHHGSTNTVNMGQPFQVTVTDFLTGKPVEGATVDGKTTDANGQATLDFQECGPSYIQATMPGSLSSSTAYIVAEYRKRCV